MPDLKFHDAASIFPLMTGDNFDQLVEDIRVNGLREPVVLLGGKILDGRNRYRACLLAGVECRAEEIETDDPVAYVLSLNRHRRHLTPSQLADVGAKAEKLYEKLTAAAKERMSAGGGDKRSKSAKSGPVNLPDPKKGDTRDKIGAMVGVSGSMIDRARKVREKGVPELAQAVEEGRMSVTRASELIDEDESEQRKVAKSATHSGGRYRNQELKHKEETNGREVRGVGVARANEAIDCLSRIPKNDALRKRGFQIVKDWIKHNQ